MVLQKLQVVIMCGLTFYKYFLLIPYNCSLLPACGPSSFGVYSPNQMGICFTPKSLCITSQMPICALTFYMYCMVICLAVASGLYTYTVS